jgi:hypothetical protein
VEAVLHVATLGVGFVHLNGKDVTEDQLTLSGWTDTESRVLFSSYNVTELLLPAGGESNVLAACVGSGWRDLNDFPRNDLATAGSVDVTHARVLRAQLVITAPVVVGTGEVAERVTVATVNSRGSTRGGGAGDAAKEDEEDEEVWLTTPAPFTASIFDGETYDASLEVGGWDSNNVASDDDDGSFSSSSSSSSSFEASDWSAAVALTGEADAPQGAMTPAQGIGLQPGIRVTQTVRPVSIEFIAFDSEKGAGGGGGSSGVYVVDFGVNLAGVVSIRIPQGTTNITLVGHVLQFSLHRVAEDLVVCFSLLSCIVFFFAFPD